MATDINRLKSIRTAYKGHCTRNKKEANEIMSSEDNPDIEELESIFEGLSLRMDKITKLDQEIFNAIDEGELANEVDLAAQYEENLGKFLKRVQKFLASSKPPTVDNGAMFDAHLPPAHPAPIQQHELLEKLPSLGVKKFHGSPLKWLAFWDSFQAAIGKRANMSDSTKMNYLLTYLEGDALSVVQNIPMTDANYFTCVDLLKDRFGREDFIIDAYMDALNNMPSVVAADVSSLRRFYDSLESYIRALETLGVPSDGYGRFLTPMLMKKIPEEIRRVILRQASEPTLELLKKLLKNEVEVQERSARCAPKPSPKGGLPDDGPPGSATMLLTQGVEKVACIFCRKGHKTENCKVVKSWKKRSQILRKQGRCFICLTKNHISKNCTQKSPCGICSGEHHVLICRKSIEGETDIGDAGKRDHDHNAIEKVDDVSKSSDVPKSEGKEVSLQCNASCVPTSSPNCTLLQTVSTFAKCRRIRRKIRILFDNAATRTFISKRLADRLKCRIVCKRVVNVGKFMDDKTKTHEFCVVILGLRTLSGKYFYLEAFVANSIAAPMPMGVPKSFLEQSPFKDLKLADDFHDDVLRVDMIIGGDVYTKLVTGNSFKEGDILATESLFGWMLMGSTNPDQPSDLNHASCYTIYASETDDKPLDEILQKFWEVSACEEEVASEDSTMTDFKQTIRYDEDEGRYCVSLPWKGPFEKRLPRNYGMCKSRLKSLVRKLTSMGLMKEYDDILQDQLNKRYTEVVPVAVECTAVHFLPHFAVIREESTTTKLRIVYDPSSTSSRFACLNDLLHKGPSLLPHLATMLMKFRLSPIGMIADIEKAFLQILLAEGDRDFTRFLWLKDPNGDVIDSNIVEMRFRRVLFGPSPSPFLMNATIRHHLDTYDDNDEIVQNLKTSFYSDNLVTGAETVEEGKSVYQRTREVFNEAGMNIRGWVTNDESLQQYFNAAFKKKETKILGLKWTLNVDSLHIAVDKLLEDIINLVVLTKRAACSLAPRLFDPLGFLEPFLIRAKIMMQELWTLKLGWDDVIPSPQCEEWKKWIEEIKDVRHLEIPRRYYEFDSSEIRQRQLHVFCDSSEKAYGAVCYLRVVANHTVATQHVFAKSRVAPLKKTTMPRLEFLATLLACAVLKHVMSALDFSESEIVCWSDSQIALFWIFGKGSPEPYVKNRLIKHQAALSLGDWKYCPSKMNPADAITRGLSMKELTESRWTDGPSWLRNEEDWPDIPILKVEEPVKTLVHHVSASILRNDISNIIDIERFSSYTKLMAVTALVFRFIRNYCCTDRKDRKLGEVTVSELRYASSAWVKAVQ